MIARFWAWLVSLFAQRKPADVIPIRPIENVAPVKLPVPAPHLILALNQVGRREGKDDAWIVGLFKYTTYKTTTSKTPWCAAFVCWLMSASGYKNTRSAGAKDQEKLGIACPDDEPGAIMVWEHTNGSMMGHKHTNVLIKKISSNTWECVGGNQSNSVSIANYGSPDYRLVSSRRPVPV
jgi:uncharacterized protein (TIGR02594 family)